MVNSPVVPRDLIAERAVLGGMLMSREAVVKVLGMLGHDPDKFFAEANRLIYAAIVARYDDDAPVDSITVANELAKTGDLSRAGGVEYLSELLDGVFSATNCEEHAKLVLDKYVARRLLETASGLVEDAKRGEMSTEELTAKFQQSAIEAATLLNHDKKTLSWARVLGEFAEDFEKRRNHPTGLLGLTTGFSDLDDMLGGLEDGDLITVGAWTSRGKSALVEQVCRWVAEQNQPVLYVSLEMSPEQTARRFISRESGVNLLALRRGRGDSAAIIRAVDNQKHLPMFFDVSGQKTVEQIVATARTAKMRWGIRLMIVDYLQRVAASPGYHKQHEAAGHISGALKGAARDIEIPVMLVSQLRRPMDVRPGVEPEPSEFALKASGDIENDSDVILLLHRPQFYERPDVEEVILKIAKQRNGPTGNVKLQFHRAMAEFRGIANCGVAEKVEVAETLNDILWKG